MCCEVWVPSIFYLCCCRGQCMFTAARTYNRYSIIFCGSQMCTTNTSSHVEVYQGVGKPPHPQFLFLISWCMLHDFAG